MQTVSLPVPDQNSWASSDMQMIRLRAVRIASCIETLHVKSPKSDGNKALLVEEQNCSSQLHVLLQAIKTGSGACR